MDYHTTAKQMQESGFFPVRYAKLHPNYMLMFVEDDADISCALSQRRNRKQRVTNLREWSLLRLSGEVSGIRVFRGFFRNLVRDGLWAEERGHFKSCVI